MVLILELSYNLPNLSACAEWNPYGITLKENSLMMTLPIGLFVDKNNTVYVADLATSFLHKWYNDSSSSTIIIPDGWYEPMWLFVLSAGDIFANYGRNGRVIKWIAANNRIETVAQFCRACFTVFIGINGMMYCSLTGYHQIVMMLLDSNSNTVTVVAGTGVPGSAAHMLDGARGIFVNINLDLYVADAENDRVQIFRSGAINGTTIPETLDAFKLLRPTSVVLDANSNIYIVDTDNHRIIAQTSYGLQCIVACAGIGRSSYELDSPLSMFFDSFGNIYAIDSSNRRVQKFLLSKNIHTCSKYDSDIKISHSCHYHLTLINNMTTVVEFLRAKCLRSSTIRILRVDDHQQGNFN